ncbi:MAG: tRNA (adenosine(37)-N6)-threonylcarbamoyltransferase complex ATPase subunit type 1 TsaE [Verrucomicrobiae bacterium]|nr:tRNA (adenosine(37)-N6)-threonylcarbamoyltransferase complex ATPase subunit type 1 TsaE [Verrucomicrobiae bacterium]
MATYISHSAAETAALGAAWGRDAQPGLVVALSGELGAGKTELVRGLAAGLDAPARVHSPSFTLLNIYSGGRLELYHIDLYRLDTPAQAVDAGLEEYLHTRGVTAIEWPEKWFGPDPAAAARQFRLTMRWVQIEIVGHTERRIRYEDFGP